MVIGDFLQPVGNVPEHAFVDGIFKRLNEPQYEEAGNPRSPLRVAVLTVPADAPVGVGTLVRLHTDGEWHILRMYDDGNIQCIRNDPRNPQRCVVSRDSISACLPQEFMVYSAQSTHISPRRWGQTIVGANSLIERQDAPGRASKVLAAEISAAMGITPISGVRDSQLQSIAGNAITNVMANAIAYTSSFLGEKSTNLSNFGVLRARDIVHDTRLPGALLTKCSSKVSLLC